MNINSNGKSPQMKARLHPFSRIGLPLAVFFGLFATTHTLAQKWTETGAGSNYWQCIASSADGSKLVAVTGGGSIAYGLIYTSTNSGATWKSNNVYSPASFESAASSADGKTLAAVGNGSWILVSTNWGNTWVSNGVAFEYLDSIACSGDGSRMIAGIHGSVDYYYSSNSGATWNLQSESGTFNYVASSADGHELALVGSYIFVSTNGGASWTHSDAPEAGWRSVASSADGAKWAAASTSGATAYVYISDDGGFTWTRNMGAPVSDTLCVASSADGRELGFMTPSQIYISTNSGSSWMSPIALFGPNWSSIACSADGSAWFATDYSGTVAGIYTLQITRPPNLNIGASATNVMLSWIVPSTNFVAQQSSDLVSWSALTNAPVLNLTNLQDRMLLSSSNRDDFYRLASP